ncbi:3-hydroxyacyl-CoA dehydrogenase family protein [uncultured Tateyamaria sp.]|uniref:3-hydroxyacyl-CoA dehydrogenase family protein n=1 Tax=Tateyamaria sp. 1078 TaxID=3417464 RepID=UPI0026197BC7|nr:3-hydroxyacyl-CoA dehydrogenase family protein [uncultured Tateyamaria sp.]
MTGIDPLQTSFWLACDALIWRHCAPWELDEALVGWGYGIGPCEAQDLAGLDRVLAARQGAGSPVLQRMVAEGRLGKAAGWGYYRYPGGGGAVIDPLIDDLVREEAWFAKVERSELEGGDLVDALHARVGPVLRDAGAQAGRLLHLPADKVAAV